MRRLVTPLGGALVFALIAGLVAGGLGWVTVAALRVEADQIAANARADAANKERLALWQLDTRLFTTLGVETNRPYAHYFATYIPYPVVLPGAGPNAEPLPVPSPLLSDELPDWMLLHFQIDGDAGWSSPQVIPPELEAKLRTPSDLPISLANVTPRRRELLDRLKAAFPKEDVLMTLYDRELSDLSDSPLAVPLNTPDPSATPAPGVEAAAAPADLSAQLVPGEPDGSKKSRPDGKPMDEAKSAAAGDSGKAMAGRWATPEAPGGGMPAPAPSARGMGGPAGGEGGAGPADRYGAATAPPKQADTVPQVGNNTAPAKGAAGKNQTDPGSSNAKDYDQRLNTRNRVMQEVQRGGEGTPNQFFYKADGQPVQPPAEGVKGKDGKNNGQKPAPTTPPAPAALAEGSPVPAAAGGLGGFGGGYGSRPDNTAPKPPAGPPAMPPGVRGNRETGEAEKQKRRSDADLMRRPAGQPEPAKDAESNESKKSVEAARLRMVRPEAEQLGKAGAKVDPKARGGEPLALAKRGNAPHLRPPAVHLGPMRPQWLHAPDGTEYLLFVRVARLESKTVFQGVVLDWPRLREVLQEEVRPVFPEARLEPVVAAADASERTMTAIPARLDPGPAGDQSPAGWTPLRLGLVIAWVAAAVALAAVAFGGWSLIDLSERRIRFVSAVTHELRTPLTSLRLYLDLLTSGMIREEEKQKEYLNTLHGESERLNRLIENVLDFARLEKRSVRAHRQPMKLADLLDQVRQTWADRCAADGKDLHVISTLPPDQEVCTDARMAAQVLGNLIDNARKYTREAADRRIWLWAKPGGRRRIVLEVEDRGAGVPAADRCTVFRPFRRGPSADTAAGGAGLGLALAKQWAEVLGGSLTCREADGGVGACFRLELPVK